MLADFSLFARNSKLTNSNFQVKSLRVSAEKGLALEPFRSLSWSKTLNLQMLVEEKETANPNHLSLFAVCLGWSKSGASATLAALCRYSIGKWVAGSV